MRGMDVSSAGRFARDGFTCVRGVLDAAEVACYVQALEALSDGVQRWTEPDGVNRHSEFWPVIFNVKLLAAVRAVLGPAIRYLPHNDLHVGFSSFSWHRDSVTRTFGEGADWDERDEPYRIVRVGIYLQRSADTQFRLGLIPGSHRLNGLSPERQRRVERRTAAAANVLSGFSGVDFLGHDAEWVSPEPGDCVIFDPRILHTGSRFHGRKRSIFLAYGVENRHFHRHWQYYLRLRSDLAYSQVPGALADRLRDAGLLAAEPPVDLAIDRAWIPSPAFVSVARRFK
jgi:hypothetical protein